jgi:hypothetical protein
VNKGRKKIKKCRVKANEILGYCLQRHYTHVNLKKSPHGESNPRHLHCRQIHHQLKYCGENNELLSTRATVEEVENKMFFF